MRRFYKQLAALLLVSIIMNEGAVTTYAETVSNNAVTETTISENTPTETTVSKDTVPDNTVSDNATGENTVPQDVSANNIDETLPENVVKTGKTIVIDGITYEVYSGEVASEVFEEAHGAASDYASRFFSFDAQDQTEYYREYYNQISDDAKVFYNALEAHINDMKSGTYELEATVTRDIETSFVVGTDDFEAFKEGYAAFDYDHPEYFWVWTNYLKMSAKGTMYKDSNNVLHYLGGYTITISVRDDDDHNQYDDYLTPAYDDATDINADISEMEQNIAAIKAEVNQKTTLYDKLAVMNDWLVDHNYYNHFLGEVSETAMSKAWKSSSALTAQDPLSTTDGAESDLDSPVCEGYSRAFKMLCDEVGIPCIVVVGAGHMWNYVQGAGGVWYAVDTTWNDPMNNELYGEMTQTQKRVYLAVGSTTVINGNSFINRHPTNGTFWVGGAPFDVPTLSTGALAKTERPLTALTAVSINDIPASAPAAAATNTIQRGKTYQLKADLIPANTDDDATVTWESSDEDVLEVDEDGIITAISVGTATITATAGNIDNRHSDTIEITVCYPVGWFSVGNDKFYGDENGDILYGWQTISGKTYYFDPDTGIMQTGVITIEGVKEIFGTDGVYAGAAPENGFVTMDGHVYFYRNGVQVTNEIVVQDKQRYYLDAIGVLKSGWFDYEGNTYYANEKGVIQTGLQIVEGDYYYFARIGTVGAMQTSLYMIDGVAYPFGSDGKLQLGSQWIVAGGERYYVKDTHTLLKGWQTIDGNRYFFEDAGYVKTGFYTTDGKTYFLDDNGVMLLGEQTLATGESVTAEQAGSYDFGTDGAMRYGWQKSGTLWKYYDPANGRDKEAVNSGDHWYQLDGSSYYFKNNTALATGWQTIDGAQYYFEPKEGADYHLGEMRTGLVVVGKNLYFLNNSIVTGLFTDSENHTYYANAKGILQLGWQKIEGVWRYFDRTLGYEVPAELPADGFPEPSGAGNQTVLNGWQKINGTWHYYLEGNEDTTVRSIDSYWYTKGEEATKYFYFNNAATLQKGWKTIGINKYYFDSVTGAMSVGLTQIGKNFYYFEPDSNKENHGAMQIGWIDDCYYGTAGYCLTGWQTIDKQKYYLDPTTGICQKGILTIGTKRYICNDQGVLMTGLVTYNGETYDTDSTGAILTGWQKVNGVLMFFDYATGQRQETASKTNGFVKLENGETYYFKNGTTMLTGLQSIDGNRYYFSANKNDGTYGQMLKGWVNAGQKRYYANEEDGVLQSGVMVILGKTYYFSEQCLMLTGWQKIGQDYYYFSPETGIKQYGVIQVGKVRYYLGEDGARQAGFVTDNGTTYYCNANGSIAIGWQTINKMKYYFNETGIMQTGFLTIGNSTYYLEPTTGAYQKGEMRTGEVLMEGDNAGTYYFNNTGVMQTGWKKIDSVWRYFATKNDTAIPGVLLGKEYSGVGVAQSNWVQITMGGKIFDYYFVGGKTLATGFKTVDGVKYYFDPISGAKQTGFITVGNKAYYLNDDGSAYTGFKTVGGDTYYYNNSGMMVTGWITLTVENVKGKYYFTPEGKRAEGFYQVGKSIYYFEETEFDPDFEQGMMKTGLIVIADGSNAGTYLLNAQGVLQTGWKTYKEAGVTYKRYFDPNEGGQMSHGDSNGMIQAGTRRYRVDPGTGERVAGLLPADDGNTYYTDTNGLVQTGWKTISKMKYYFDPVTGAMYKGIHKIGTDWYCFNPQGIMQTGSVESYFYSTNGTRQYGWQKVGDNWRYYDQNTGIENTNIIENNGWRTVTFGVSPDTYERQYYIDQGKTLVKNGWKTVPGPDTGVKKSFYFNSYGELQKGAFAVNGVRYFTVTDGQSDPGSIYTGFLQLDGNWSYCDTKGKMVTGWLNLTDNGVKKSYYFNPNGVMCTGKNLIKGKYYYFSKDGATPFTDDFGILKKGEIHDAADNRDYYADANGILKNGWQSVGGAWKYYDLTNYNELPATLQPDGWATATINEVEYKYYFKGGTKLLKGKQTIDGHSYYFDAATGTLLTGEFSIGTTRYRTDPTTGEIQSAGFVTTADSAQRYFDKNGKMVIGWITIGTDKYYTDHNGVLLTGFFYVGKTRYHADRDGKILTGFCTIAEERYYFDKNGAMQTGWKTISVSGSNKRYYFGSDGKMYRNGIYNIGGKQYCFDADGILLVGQVVNMNGSNYYLTASGVIQYGWFKLGDTWRFFNVEGKEISSSDVTPPSDTNYWASVTENGTTSNYYFVNNKTLAKGWKSIKDTATGNEYRYYFNAQGVLQTGDTAGILIISGVIYRVNPVGGQVEDGIHAITGSKYLPDGIYCFNTTGKMVTGWQTISGQKYYFNPDGTMVTGAVRISGIFYLFDENGVLQINRLEDNPTQDSYYTNANGVIQTGWKKVRNIWRYYDVVTGKEEINIATDGYWKTVTSTSGTAIYYFINGMTMATGWQTLAGNRYYFDAQGVLQTGEFTIGKIGYRADATGKVYVNTWYTDEAGHRYYYNNKGIMLLGWQTIAGNRYYFDPITGIMQTGIVTINKKDYFFDDAGIQCTGIINYKGTMMYLTKEGVLQRGWFRENGKLHYANEETCELYTGFHELNGVRYYFSEKMTTLGEMQTGFFKVPDLGQSFYDKAANATNTYYAHDNGALIEGGWQVIKKEESVNNAQQWSFYFEPDENSPYYGEMIKGTPRVINGTTYGALTLDGKEYLFNYTTGARHKITLYFHGGYYGKPINIEQYRVTNSISKYVNSDMKFETMTPDFIMATAGGKNDPYPAANYPLAASSFIEEERVLNKFKSNTIYVADNDIMAYDSTTGAITPGKDGAVDVCDVEAYCWDIYCDTLADYGAENVVLVGTSSGGGIALALLQKAAATTRDADPSNNVPQAADTILLSPSLSAAMDHDTPVLDPKLTEGCDYDTFKYWGARYTRDASYTQKNEDDTIIQPYEDHPGPGVHYAFATPVDQSFEGLRNITIYVGSYDNCYNDCLLAKQKGGSEVTLKSYPRMTHGYMFSNSDAATKTVLETAWIIMKENNAE